jgi:hypothetical protein
LLVEGRANIAGTNEEYSALELAVITGDIAIVEWLLVEGWANVSEVGDDGFTALLTAAHRCLTGENVQMVQWLLEYGGADITNTTPDGRTVWKLVEDHFFDFNRRWLELGDVVVDLLPALLRVMVLQSAPSADLLARMPPQHLIFAEEKEHGYGLGSPHTSHGGGPSWPKTHR